MNVTVNLDMDDVYSELGWSQQTEFIESHIEEASDDKIISEVFERSCEYDVLSKMDEETLRSFCEEQYDLWKDSTSN